MQNESEKHMNRNELVQEIRRLKKEKNAAILVHNYQRSEIQEVADYLGDSLDLAKRATALQNPVIVFCGVHFMAESAAILNPHKTILLPEIDAGCPLADCASAEEVRAARKRHPEAVFIAYINTSAAVKAEVDVICTSANAMKIISHYKGREICYLPDKNLAGYVEKQLEIDIIKWPGQCYVHDRLITEDAVKTAIKANPEAMVLAHPEAPENVLKLAHVVTGTSGMINTVKVSNHKDFIIVTETGLTQRMAREFPSKNFIEIASAICSQMKLTTLQSLYEALKLHRHVITVPENTAAKARTALNRMLELSE